MRAPGERRGHVSCGCSTATRFCAAGRHHAEARAAFRELNRTLRRARWRSFEDVARAYPPARAIKGNRVILNARGNAYCMIVAMDCARQAAFIKFVGTHAAYRKIGAEIGERVVLSVMQSSEQCHHADPRWRLPTRLLSRKSTAFGTPPNTPEGDRRDVLMTLADADERQQWPDDDLDPIDAIKARMENSGGTRKDRETIVGSSGRTPEILNRRHHLTPAMIWSPVRQWEMPAEVLVGLTRCPDQRNVSGASAGARRHRATAFSTTWFDRCFLRFSGA